MIVLLIIVILVALILILAITVYYFFSIAFVKHNIGNTDDIDDKLNKPLQKYREIILAGMDFIKNKEHKWVNTVSFDGLNLAARYYDIGSPKTMILFHGYRSSAARDFSCAVKMYICQGFNVLLCDQRSHGRSEGRLITFGVKESSDVLSWIEYATEKLGASKIALGGMSMGATTVLLSVGKGLPKEVRCIIADCGFTSPIAIIKKVAAQSFKINATPFLPFLNLYCLLLGRFSLYKSDVVKVLKNSDIPVIFIHGKEDGFVPSEMSVDAYSSSSKNSKLLLIDGADHGLSYLVDTPKVEKELEEFLKKWV